MARRKRRSYGSPPAAHSKRADHAYNKSLENSDRAVELARHHACTHAVGALATAEYWRGRGDAESEGAGGAMGRSKPGVAMGTAYTAVSKCFDHQAIWAKRKG